MTLGTPVNDLLLSHWLTPQNQRLAFHRLAQHLQHTLNPLRECESGERSQPARYRSTGQASQRQRKLQYCDEHLSARDTLSEKSENSLAMGGNDSRWVRFRLLVMLAVRKHIFLRVVVIFRILIRPTGQPITAHDRLDSAF
jgi:hypothetical protein